MIKFKVLGTPVAKGRARSTNKGFHYTPQKTRDAENSFIAKSIRFRPEKQIDEPVSLSVVYSMPIPKSFSKKKRQQALNNEIFPAKKPDLDNLVKLTKDAMNEIFWTDDKLVVSIEAHKFYSDTPKTEVSIITMSEVLKEAKKYDDIG